MRASAAGVGIGVGVGTGVGVAVGLAVGVGVGDALVLADADVLGLGDGDGDGDGATTDGLSEAAGAVVAGVDGAEQAVNTTARARRAATGRWFVIVSPSR